jgi:hypothetical protein
VGPGEYRTTHPVPADGTWKSAFRLHRGSEMASVPLFMPADPGIPAKEVPAPASFERAFTADHTILQRERTDGASGGLWHVAIAAVLGGVVALLLLLGWALRRIAGAPRPERPGAAVRTRVGVA